MSLHKITLTISFIILSTIALITMAQPEKIPLKVTTPNLYQIELIVFEHITPSVENQAWPNQINLSNLTNAIELTPSSLNKNTFTTYQSLPSKYFKLNTEMKRLAKQSDYRILLHIAWLQLLANSQSAEPIHIYGGETFYDNNKVFWQINGTMTFNINHFIDLAINLIFTQPKSNLSANLDNNPNSTLQSYQLKERRRTKPNELNYFDNPMFGVLIKIIPFAPPSQ